VSSVAIRIDLREPTVTDRVTWRGRTWVPLRVQTNGQAVPDAWVLVAVDGWDAVLVCGAFVRRRGIVGRWWSLRRGFVVLVERSWPAREERPVETRVEDVCAVGRALLADEAVRAAVLLLVSGGPG